MNTNEKIGVAIGYMVVAVFVILFWVAVIKFLMWWL